MTYSSGTFAVGLGAHSIGVELIDDSFIGPGHGYLRVDVLENGACGPPPPGSPPFTVTSLPSDGTLSYISPLNGLSTDITTVPLILPSEQVTYTPPVDATTGTFSFTAVQFDGVTTATVTVDVTIVGAIIIDSCADVGRDPFCMPGSEVLGGESTENRTIEVPPLIDTLKGPLLTVVVEGPGTVTSNPKRYLGDRLLGLVCTTDSVCSLTFALGTEVTLLARPQDGESHFVGWYGQCEAGDEDELMTTSMTLGSSFGCRAVFESDEKDDK